MTRPPFDRDRIRAMVEQDAVRLGVLTKEQAQDLNHLSDAQLHEVYMQTATAARNAGAAQRRSTAQGGRGGGRGRHSGWRGGSRGVRGMGRGGRMNAGYLGNMQRGYGGMGGSRANSDALALLSGAALAGVGRLMDTYAQRRDQASRQALERGIEEQIMQARQTRDANDRWIEMLYPANGGWDREAMVTVPHPTRGSQRVPVGVVVQAFKDAPPEEQEAFQRQVAAALNGATTPEARNHALNQLLHSTATELSASGRADEVAGAMEAETVRLEAEERKARERQERYRAQEAAAEAAAAAPPAPEPEAQPVPEETAAPEGLDQAWEQGHVPSEWTGDVPEDAQESPEGAWDAEVSRAMGARAARRMARVNGTVGEVAVAIPRKAQEHADEYREGWAEEARRLSDGQTRQTPPEAATPVERLGDAEPDPVPVAEPVKEPVPAGAEHEVRVDPSPTTVNNLPVSPVNLYYDEAGKLVNAWSPLAPTTKTRDENGNWQTYRPQGALRPATYEQLQSEGRASGVCQVCGRALGPTRATYGIGRDCAERMGR